MNIPRIFVSSIIPKRFYCTPTVSTLQGGAVADFDPPRDKLFNILEVELRGIDPAVLKSYSWFATTTADHLGIQVGQW